MGAQPLLVWKFGGTSLSDLARLRAAAQRMVAARQAGHRLVTILSAMGSSTDELNASAYAMSTRPQLRELDALLSVGENIPCALDDVEPDVVVASKALSGIGQPIAIILYDERLDVWAPGAHTGTFRGNQLAFAAGAAAVRIVRRDDVLGNVRSRSAQIAQRFDVLRDHPWVRDVRGRGLMWGIELGGPLSGCPAGDLAARVQSQALADGLIIELGGRNDCVVRLLPPLNVSPEVVDMACTILIAAIERCSDEQADAPSPVGSLELVPVLEGD